MALRNIRDTLFKAVFASCCFVLPCTSTYAAEQKPLNLYAWNTYKREVLDVLPKLQGWCSREKADRMMDLILTVSPQICVEIGVFGGSSFYPTAAALEYQKKGIAYAIDPWYTEPCLEGNAGENYDWWATVDLEKIMQGFIQSMKDGKLEHRYCLFRMTSKEALSVFQNGKIDIIHIDGNHSEDSALFDVKNWLPKVRQGGYIWFDDANWQSTNRAVDFLLKHCELDPSSKLGDPYLLFRKK